MRFLGAKLDDDNMFFLDGSRRLIANIFAKINPDVLIIDLKINIIPCLQERKQIAAVSIFEPEQNASTMGSDTEEEKKIGQEISQILDVIPNVGLDMFKIILV